MNMTEPVELSGNQCLEQLRRHGVGRVAFGTPMGPRIAPVEYTLAGSEIVFRTTPYSEVGTYAPDSEVAFEIDDSDAGGRCDCAVVALGRAEIVDMPVTVEPDLVRDEGGRAEPRGGYRWIKVRTHDFTGLRVPEQADRTGT